MDLLQLYQKNANLSLINSLDFKYKLKFNSYMKVLCQYGKVSLSNYSPSFTINLNVNNMLPFVLYYCEFEAFIKFITEELLCSNPLVGTETCFNLVSQILSANSKQFTEAVECYGITSKQIEERIQDYKSVSDIIPEKLGSTIPQYFRHKGGKTEKYEAMFADLVSTVDLRDAMSRYNDIMLLDTSKVNSNLATDIYLQADSIISFIKGSIEPLFSGSIISDRVEEDKCPVCGEIYKGVFSKKCGSCRLSKAYLLENYQHLQSTIKSVYKEIE